MSLSLERFSNKTRVVICGKEDRKQVSELLLFVIKFLGNNIDYITEKQKIVLRNDFVVFEVDENHDDFLNIKPNIAAITGNEDDSEKIELLLKTITPGGILIYNEEDENLKDLVENAENYFRRIPYKTPGFSDYKPNHLPEYRFGRSSFKLRGRKHFFCFRGETSLSAYGNSAGRIL